MTKTFCGKQCNQCNENIQQTCTGCKYDNGKGIHSDCEIAVCCWNKGHVVCDTCTYQQGCATLKRNDNMLYEREQKRAEAERKKAEVMQKAPFLSKWLTNLFWLLIVAIIVAICGLSVIKDIAPEVAWYGERVGYLCFIAEGLILLFLSKVEERYQIAGFCKIAIACIQLLMLVLPVNESLLITIGLGVLGIIAMYYLYTGHANVVRDANAELANQWMKLWKWTAIGFGSALVSVLAMFISSFITFVGIIVFGVILIGAAVLQMVYLYRMAKLFRNMIK